MVLILRSHLQKHGSARQSGIGTAKPGTAIRITGTQKEASMTLSPCRNCPNRHMDKNVCMRTCELLNRVQAYQAGCMAPPLFSAVDFTDEGRYGVVTALDVRSSTGESLAC